MLPGGLWDIWLISSSGCDVCGDLSGLCWLLCFQRPAQAYSFQHSSVSHVLLRHHSSWSHPQQVLQGHQHCGRDSSTLIFGSPQLLFQHHYYAHCNHHCHTHFLDCCRSGGHFICPCAGTYIAIYCRCIKNDWSLVSMVMQGSAQDFLSGSNRCARCSVL